MHLVTAAVVRLVRTLAHELSPMRFLKVSTPQPVDRCSRPGGDRCGTALRPAPPTHAHAPVGVKSWTCGTRRHEVGDRGSQSIARRRPANGRPHGPGRQGQTSDGDTSPGLRMTSSAGVGTLLGCGPPGAASNPHHPSSPAVRRSVAGRRRSPTGGSQTVENSVEHPTTTPRPGRDQRGVEAVVEDPESDPERSGARSSATSSPTSGPGCAPASR